MKWSLRAVLVLALTALAAAPAAAQITGHPFEVSGGAGYLHYDARARVKDGPDYMGIFGIRVSSFLTIEGQASFGPGKADTASDLAHNHSFAGGDLRWNLRPADGHVVPFILTGGGYGLSHTTGTPPDELRRGYGDLGLGALFNLGKMERTYLRLEVRDFMFREREQKEFSNQLAATIGLTWMLRGKHRDQDLDGVRDWLDKCPNTPIGAKVDRNGCPIDSDGDGVFDGIDKCPDTPKGAKVDRNGCPIDSDGDGVPDGIDQCPDTPKGAKVDAKGCPIDSDGDGVPDGIDQCPNTPTGAKVDAKGCPIDSDGDGVPDGLDKCPDTPAGLKVDVNGCPIEITTYETQLLDTGRIRLNNINFDTGKATIRPESDALLDTVGAVLKSYPMLKIEIGGHTDNVGGQAMNQKLSEARAKSVLDYLRTKYPDLDAAKMTVKGYGMSQPVTTNRTVKGRAMNRRVEFRVLNPQDLKIEKEKRGFLKKEVAAPPDTTRKP